MIKNKAAETTLSMEEKGASLEELLKSVREVMEEIVQGAQNMLQKLKIQA